MNFAVVAHVADHVPMDRAVVLAARFGVALADSDMHRPTDLLIKQDAARKALNAEIRANGELTEIARPRVSVQLRLQEFVVFLGVRFYHIAILEFEFDALDRAPAHD